jgi:hypothetical protein
MEEEGVVRGRQDLIDPMVDWVVGVVVLQTVSVLQFLELPTLVVVAVADGVLEAAMAAPASSSCGILIIVIILKH